MLEILAVIIFPFLFFQALWLMRLRKHDVHLYRFCQLRRDSIKFMYDEHQSLSRTDYIALRKLIRVLNLTINNYKAHKKTLFDFRAFTLYMREIRPFEERVEEISTNNERIKELRERMFYAVIEAFFAYTPFLKHEAIARLIFFILSAAVKSGAYKFKNELNILTQINQSRVHLKELAHQ